MLSARELHHAVRDSGLDRALTKTFARRLHWRDLAYYQLHVFPRMADAPIRAHYAEHAWSDDAPAHLVLWKRGRTGYPMVDAGMCAPLRITRPPRRRADDPCTGPGARCTRRGGCTSRCAWWSRPSWSSTSA